MSLIFNYGSVWSLKDCGKARDQKVHNLHERLAHYKYSLTKSGCFSSTTFVGLPVQDEEHTEFRARVRNSSQVNMIGHGCSTLKCCRERHLTVGFDDTICKASVARNSSQAKLVSNGRSQLQPKHARKREGFVGNDVCTSKGGYWRLFSISVPVEKDPGRDDFSISDGVLEAIASALKCQISQLSHSCFSVVRKSLDARKHPRFVYTIDLDVEIFLQRRPNGIHILSKLHNLLGKAEFSCTQRNSLDLVSRIRDLGPDVSHSAVGGPCEDESAGPILSRKGFVSDGRGPSNFSRGVSSREKPKVVIVGAGPAGLFASLSLAEAGVDVVLLERGEPVESRGRDIGALMVRRVLNPNSNLCFGEGGAGTWSDGKLTTRIGKNSSAVQTVLATLVRFGAPSQILVDGKPHVGTDKLVCILKSLRCHLLGLGVNIMFGTKVENLETHSGRVTGVRVSKVNGKVKGACGDLLRADAVVLGVGHSARDMYEILLQQGVLMTQKPFAVGFRIEHPQELINEVQYRRWASEAQRHGGKLPVADYKLTSDVGSAGREKGVVESESEKRSCYSFCMCPGGQVVPTCTTPEELCVNGMSFSNRASRWANAALVVSVSTSDLLRSEYNNGPLAGVEFQRIIEREAAVRGGGRYVAPVQTVTDFLDDRLSGSTLPSSSYRLGVKAAFLHDILPSYLTVALKEAILSFEKQLPGYIDRRALLHGVETRTSSPLRIERNKETFESVSLTGLYPVGEGAGYAGGIVSAAVDGMIVGLALSDSLYSSNSLLQNLSP